MFHLALHLFCVVVCIDLSGKEPYRCGNLDREMFSTQAQNATNVAFIGEIFPISSHTSMTLA